VTWTPVRTADGSWTLLAEAVGETCHSRSGAWQQARERYAAGCDLQGAGGRAGAGGTVRLLDVGTGLGLNLAAALEALAPTGARLEATSLELDPEPLRAACALYEARPGPWEPWHGFVRGALRQALEGGGGPVPLGPSGRLTLRLGDARGGLEPGDAGSHDAIFLDPFSPGRAPELWEPSFLGPLGRCLGPTGLLATYSAAFRVRLALLASGLRVGKGPRVGSKGEGTLASWGREVPPLPPRVARRLERAFLALPGGDRPRVID
jgi:tRNA U34 5-methylaminomethyl-2-thiouridine-forming methyltransferase MnmC